MRTTGLIAALALFWGSGFFWIKLALAGFTPLQLTFGRLALGALVLLPIVFIRHLRGPRSRAMWGHLLVSAIFACALPYSLFAIAEQTISSSLAGVLNSTTPLWTVLLATWFHTERGFSARRALGIGLGLVGAILVVSPWNDSDPGSAFGALACLAAALSYAIAYTYQSRFLVNRGVSPVAMTSAQLTIAAAILAIALPFSETAPSPPTTTAWIAVITLGAVGTGLALTINFTLIAAEGATTASVVTYLVPVVAVILGTLLLDEYFTVAIPMGAALVLLGVALARRERVTS